MKVAALIVIALQALVMLVDEARFHRRRGLPRWERIGHPIDTASVLACCIVTVACEPTTTWLTAYTVLAIASCILVTKDEFVHSRECEPAEHWLHALLFVLHPLLLIGLCILWLDHESTALLAQTLATALFGLYQALYWNFVATALRPDATNTPALHPRPE